MRLGTYYRWLLRESLGLLPESHERVLDVGCYDGYLVSRIACHLKVAIDLEPSPHAYHPVWQADARRLPFRSEAFDRVYLLDVIEHVVDYGTVLAEAMRVLRPGGILWISTPSLYWWVVPPFLTGMLDRRWEHVRRGHTVEDIEARVPPTSRVSTIHWNMPCFRLFYFPVRVLWCVWPSLAQRLLSSIAECDQRSKPGQSGHLFASVTKSR